MSRKLKWYILTYTIKETFSCDKEEMSYSSASLAQNPSSAKNKLKKVLKKESETDIEQFLSVERIKDKKEHKHNYSHYDAKIDSMVCLCGRSHTLLMSR